MSVCSSSIDAYLRQIAARLPGPAGARRAILAELRDGLLHAVEEHEQEGMADAAAVDLAVKRFGDPAGLAAAFWPELAAARARRTVWAVWATAPIVAALWMAAARSRGMTARSGLFDGTPTHAFAVILALVAVGAGVWTLAGTGHASRWLGLDPRGFALAAAAVAGTTMLADLALLALLSWRLAAFPGTIHRLALALAMLASGARLLLAGRAGRSCLQARTLAAGSG
jgi:HAAS